MIFDLFVRINIYRILGFSSKPPPGDPHQNCTQFGDGRNGGLIVKRPLSNFVR